MCSSVYSSLTLKCMIFPSINQLDIRGLVSPEQGESYYPSINETRDTTSKISITPSPERSPTAISSLVGM